MQLQQGTLLQNGKYKITRVLGQGGFGITYMAEQTMIDRVVCIKEFFVKQYCGRNEDTSQVSLGTKENEEMMRRYMAKFIKEAQTVAKLSHGNIVQIYDSFYENNTAYAVMEYIDGCTLAEWVRDHGPVSEETAVDYMHQIGAALSYAHDRRVTHLDVKPSNIMLADGGKKAILIDFGMAKHYGETGMETSNTPVGVSHGYAPLEQYQSGGVKGFSPATDIYALGATLYYALKGERPAPAAELMMKDDGLKDVEGDFSSSVKDAIIAAMQSRKESRPQSVEDFLDLLDAPDEPEVTILSVEVDPEPDFKVKVDSHPIKKDNMNQKKTARLPLITIVYLALGLVVGAVVFGLVWAIRSETIHDYWNPSPGWDFGFILSAAGVLIAEIGVVLMLCRWKGGFWMLLLGGFVFLVMMVMALVSKWPERAVLIFSVLIPLLFVYGITFLVLQIKGKQGISGWGQFKNGFPKSLKQMFHP